MSRHFSVVDSFIENGRQCYVVESSVLGLSHNGYVEVVPQGDPAYREDYSDYDLSQEITYQSTSGHFKQGMTCIGFDTNHYNDTAETKSFGAVRAATVALALEMGPIITGEKA